MKQPRELRTSQYHILLAPLHLRNFRTKVYLRFM